jgi:hypothetical protein
VYCLAIGEPVKHEISIEHLTPEQMVMLDFMWSLDTAEELEEWQALLCPEDLITSRLLQQLLMYEVMESALPGDFKEAKQVLDRFKLL